MRSEQFLNLVNEELKLARAKFPCSDGALAALTEEVGEVANAMLDKPFSDVQKECVQVAVMALRLACEGDNTLSELRDKRGCKRMCGWAGCPAPHFMSGPCAVCYE